MAGWQWVSKKTLSEGFIFWGEIKMSKRIKRKTLVFSSPFEPESPVWQLKWLCSPCPFPSNCKERPSSGSTEEGLQWAVCTALCCRMGAAGLRPARAHVVGSWSPGNVLDPGTLEFLALCLQKPFPTAPLSMGYGVVCGVTGKHLPIPHFVEAVPIWPCGSSAPYTWRGT